MQKKLLIITLSTALITSFGGMSHVGWAEEDTIAELKQQMKVLQERVAELEAQRMSPSLKDDSWDFYNQRQRRWDPFAEMDRMQAEMNRMFEDAYQQRGPRKGGGLFSSSMGYNVDFDLKETDDGYEIVFDMQGLDEDKVDIQINANSITIKGEHSSENTEQGPNQYFQAQSFGTFMQTIPLPVDADTAKIKTEKKGDSLVITMPKRNT